MSTTTSDELLEQEFERAIPAPSLRRLVLATGLTLALGLGGLGGWAATTTLERAVIASGPLVAEGKRKTITLLEPGILRELLVREGQTVQTGQVLLRLDLAQAEAAANQARAAYWGAVARVARLRAELHDQRGFTLPAETRAVAGDPLTAAQFEAEQRIFAARWRAYEGAVAVQQLKVTQQQEQISALAAQRTAANTKLRATREELGAVTQLLGHGLVPRPRHWELQRQEAELLGSLGQFASQEAQLRESIAQAQAELATLGLNRQQDIAKELGDVQATLADARQRMLGAEDVLNRREVTAPEPGSVTDIKFFTPGSSIGAGMPILDLVPLGDRLVAEIQVSLNDIEQVRVGQAVNIRLSSYRQHDVPLIPGRLIYVAADRQEDGRGNVYFVARAELDAEFLRNLGPLPMAAGMPTEVYILGEQRSALDYLFRPLKDELRRALRN